MDERTYPVGTVARMAGVTVRTLHHYDAIGLLRPTGRAENGYRRYSEADIERLQRILFYRELELGLDRIKDAMADPDLKQAAEANTPANFAYVFRRALEGLFIDRMEQNEDIFNRFMSDPNFRKVIEEMLGQQVYENMRSEVANV